MIQRIAAVIILHVVDATYTVQSHIHRQLTEH